MPKIVFWSANNVTTGSEHAVIAITTLLAIQNKSTCLLMQANFNSKKIESSYTPYDIVVRNGAFNNPNIGIAALIRLIASNKLSADSIQNYAKPVLKERLDVLYGISSDDLEGYKQLANNLPYVLRKADEIYDIVFADIPKTLKNKCVIDTIQDSDIVICIVNQDIVKIDNLFNILEKNEVLKAKNKIIVISDYEQDSKFNITNIRNKYKIKDPIYCVPHNYIFSDACNSGNVIDFVFRNLNVSSNANSAGFLFSNPNSDYNGYFFKCTNQIVDKIMDLMKPKGN